VLAPPEQGTPPKLCERYGIVADNCKATTYYHFGSQRVAMREQTDGNPTGAVYWLHSDHLGSASLTTDAGGGKFAELRYKPWGEVRWSSGAMPTDRRFTGMTTHAGLGGLVTMGVREYLPSLGRWLSADTVVPSTGNPQSLNRFSYVYNRPLVFTDPTGYCAAQDNECWIDRYNRAHGLRWDGTKWEYTTAIFDDDDIAREVLAEAGISILGNWNSGELSKVAVGIVDLIHAIAKGLSSGTDLGASVKAAASRLRQITGGSVFHRVADVAESGLAGSLFAKGRGACVCNLDNKVWFGNSFFSQSNSAIAQYTVHEVGHVIDNHSGGSLRGQFANLPKYNGTTGLHTYSDDQGGRLPLVERFGEAVAVWVYGSKYVGAGRNFKNLDVNQAAFVSESLQGIRSTNVP
jgi:RHS repeat-associated protein